METEAGWGGGGRGPAPLRSWRWGALVSSLWGGLSGNEGRQARWGGVCRKLWQKRDRKNKK